MTLKKELTESEKGNLRPIGLDGAISGENSQKELQATERNICD